MVEAEEEISKQDWLTVKAITNPRDELEKIKEDRVEYQEVGITHFTGIRTLH